jgi:exopolysaccharide production protein ExoQ
VLNPARTGSKTWVTLITGVLFVLYSNNSLISSNFTLLERGSVGLCLSLLGLIAGTTSRPRPVFLPTPLVLLLMAMLLSLSSRPELAYGRDYLGMLAIAISAMVLVISGERAGIVNGIAFGGATTALLLVATIVFRPEESWSPNGQLIALFGQWNSVAIALTFSLPAILFISLKSRRGTWLLRVGLSLFIFALIFATGSRSSLIVATAILVLGVGAGLLKSHRRFGLIYFALFFVSAALLLLAFQNVLSALGKDDTLTGRIPLWIALLSRIDSIPLQGIGWSQLFPANSSLAVQAAAQIGFFPEHSHNDALHWFITTGALGLVALSLCFATIMWFGWRSYFKSDTSDFGWVAISGLGLIMGGLTELSSFYPEGFFILSASVAMSVSGITANKKVPLAQWLRIEIGPGRRSR